MLDHHTAAASAAKTRSASRIQRPTRRRRRGAGGAGSSTYQSIRPASCQRGSGSDRQRADHALVLVVAHGAVDPVLAFLELDRERLGLALLEVLGLLLDAVAL